METEKYTILVVDDIPKNIQVVANILGNLGYNVEVATSGHSGWTTSQYCTEEFSIDIDGSGDIDANEIINCDDVPISTACSTTSSTALGTLSLTEVECNPAKYSDALGGLQTGA